MGPPAVAMVRPADASDSRDAVRLLAQLGYDRTADSVADDLQTGAAGRVSCRRRRWTGDSA